MAKYDNKAYINRMKSSLVQHQPFLETLSILFEKESKLSDQWKNLLCLSFLHKNALNMEYVLLCMREAKFL